VLWLLVRVFFRRKKKLGGIGGGWGSVGRDWLSERNGTPGGAGERRRSGLENRRRCASQKFRKGHDRTETFWKVPKCKKISQESTTQNAEGGDGREGDREKMGEIAWKVCPDTRLGRRSGHYGDKEENHGDCTGERTRAKIQVAQTGRQRNPDSVD